jgi:H+/Cl- antiporter ClcA
MISAVLTGLVAVAYAHLIEGATKFAGTFSSTHPYWFLVLAVVGFMTSRALVVYVAPYASGSGIPQVMAALQSDLDIRKDLRRKLFGLRVLLVKITSSVLALGGGAAVGREGPMIQIATCIFMKTASIFRAWLPELSSHAKVLAGGAAGIAAAFNTPLGGIVFALEELVSPHFYKIKTALITAVILSGIVAQSFLGPYLYIGALDIPGQGLKSLAVALIVGLIAGASGSIFGKVLIETTGFARRLNPVPAILFAGLCGLAVGLLGIFYGPLSLGGGVQIIRERLFNSYDDGSLFLARFATTSMSFSSGISGGVFAPSLALGGEAGAAISKVFTSLPPRLSIVLGMTAFLAGFTHAPFTSFVLVMEMTGNHLAIFPIMMAAISATFISKILTPKSFYHVQTVRILSDTEMPIDK